MKFIFNKVPSDCQFFFAKNLFFCYPNNIMKKIIPRHSLIIIISNENDFIKNKIRNLFNKHEIISSNTITEELIGDPNRLDIKQIVMKEIINRANIKLNLGERVVVETFNLKKEERVSLAKVGFNLGVPVFYLCDILDDNISKGDGIADVIDINNHEIIPIIREKKSYENLKNEWNGITVVADIHGMMQSLLSVIDWAKSRNHYIIFLGDIIDYGPNSIEVVDEIYNLIMRGNAEMTCGNHEKKIKRWLKQNEFSKHQVKLSEGNKVTTTAFNNLSFTSKIKWESRFHAIISHSNFYRTLSNTTFAHAAIHPDYWTKTATSKEIETMTLYGEFERLEDSIIRKYEWVNAIPNDKLVIVGHDIRSKIFPMRVENINNGTAIFLDTGSGKGGHLSSIDLKFTDNGFKIENYNSW